MIKKPKSKIQEYAEAIIIAILIAFFIRTFVVQAFKIPSGSMKPTLLIGDHILVSKFIYGIKIPYFRKTLIPVRDPQRGETHLQLSRGPPGFQEGIGVGVDTIEIRNMKIFLNGMPYDDKRRVCGRLHHSGVHSTPTISPVTVPWTVFAMATIISEHSRFSFVDLKETGKAFILLVLEQGRTAPSAGNAQAASR